MPLIGFYSGVEIAPVNGRMTSGYGMRRHPILGYTRMHAGVDFGAAWGSPIFAVSDEIGSRFLPTFWLTVTSMAWSVVFATDSLEELTSGDAVPQLRGGWLADTQTRRDVEAEAREAEIAEQRRLLTIGVILTAPTLWLFMGLFGFDWRATFIVTGVFGV